MARGLLPSVAVFIGLLVVTGCSQERTDTKKARPPFSLEKVKLTCADAESCTGNIGLLFRKEEVMQKRQRRTEISVHGCTAFAMAKDILVTASDCLPLDLQNVKGEQIVKDMHFLAPQTNALPSQLIAVQVVLRSEASESQWPSPSFAFLRLARPIEGEPLDIDSSGIEVEESLRVTAVTFDRSSKGTGEYNFRLESFKDCKVLASPLFHPFAFHPKMETMSLAGCRISPQHLGAPLIGTKGVKGLVQGFYDGNKLYDHYYAKFPQLLSSRDPYQRHFVLAANVSCVPTESIWGDLSPVCQSTNRPISALINFPNGGEYFYEVDKVNLVQLVSSRISRNLLGITLVLSSEAVEGQPDLRKVFLRPHCFNAQEIESVLKKHENLTPNHALNFYLPYLYVEQRINRHFQLRTHQVFEHIGEYRLSFHWNLNSEFQPSALKALWRVTEEDGQAIDREFVISACSNENVDGPVDLMHIRPRAPAEGLSRAIYDSKVSGGVNFFGLKDDLLKVIDK